MQEQQIDSPIQPHKKRITRKTVITVVVTAVISIILSFSIFVLTFLTGTKSGKLFLLEAMLNFNFYGEIDREQLYDGAVSGMLAGTGDKYAGYYNKEETEDRNMSLEGIARGIGISIVPHPDTGNIYVRNVYEDSPAKKAGILEGDQILSIDDKKVSDVGYVEAVKSIARELGETADLELLRGESRLTVEVPYIELTVQSVFKKVIFDNVGYVRITAFNAETPSQFKDSITDLMNKGVESLVFDLRRNGGGTVDSVIEMVDFLCPAGDIMTCKYADGREEVIARSDENEINLPMVVLTDGGTASAAELFAASIKDFGKGISVGTKTYGKGVMQSTFPFPDGTCAVFTVAEFFPHSGRSFNEKGIEPDVKVELTEEQLFYFVVTKTEEDPVVKAAAETLK